VAVMVMVPSLPAPGANVTVHVPELVVHWALAGVNDPELDGEAENVTVPPVGVILVPGEVSDTVAVQVELAVTGTLAGEHDMLIDEVLTVAVTAVTPGLEMWLESPP